MPTAAPSAKQAPAVGTDEACCGDYAIDSNNPAAPMPVPMHMLTMP